MFLMPYIGMRNRIRKKRRQNEYQHRGAVVPKISLTQNLKTQALIVDVKFVMDFMRKKEKQEKIKERKAWGSWFSLTQYNKSNPICINFQNPWSCNSWYLFDINIGMRDVGNEKKKKQRIKLNFSSVIFFYTLFFNLCRCIQNMKIACHRSGEICDDKFYCRKR